MTPTLLEPPLSPRHTAPGLFPGLRSAGAPHGTPLDLDGVRDLSVRAAIADLNGELRSALFTVGNTCFLVATDVAASVWDGVAVVVSKVADALVLGAPAAAPAAPPSPESAYEAVQFVADVLGLPKTDVTAAAGIAPRTYHSWANGGTPRIQSQGSLWRLVHTAEDLLELIGSREGVVAWIRSEPVRRETFSSGQVDRLLADAVLDFTPAPTKEHDAISQLATAGGDRYIDDDALPVAGRAPRGSRVPTRSRTAVRARHSSLRENQE